MFAKNGLIKTNKGMLNFLQLKLQKYPLSQWNNRIAKMKPGFSGHIKVLPISKVNLSASEISELKRKKVFVKMEDERSFLGIDYCDHFLYKIIPHSQYVFKTYDFTLNDIAQYMLAWNNKLITMELYNAPQKNWNKIANRMQKIYGYPLSIISKTDPKLSAKELSNLQVNDTTIEETKKEEVRNFYSKIPGTNFLIHTGPMPIDYFDRYEMHIIYATFLFVVLCFLFISHLFFGRAIRKIFIITDHYSRGDFNVTTKLSKYSSMYRVYANILEMGQRIKNLMKSQQVLTRLVAHESRTPISRMLFIIEKMEKLQYGDKLQQDVANLKENLNELNDLTNNFLCYSRLTSKQLKLDLKKTNIVNLIKMSVKKYIDNKQHIKISTTFNLSKIEQAIVDKKYMGYALNNLIDNAFRYAKNQIKISVWNTAEKLFIAVEDDGIIIHYEDKKNVFEPFIRLKSEHDNLDNGYGLGLSIVKAIVELHCGTIEVFDSALGGTKFLITLPVQSKY
jgi:two-component system sensor histidine kinase RstB